MKDVFSEAQLATLRSPNLFTTNAAGLALGYVTRVRDGQTTVEQINQVNDGVVTALPIDLGPAADQVFLTLLGSNLGNASTGTATIGGVTATLLYAGPQPGAVGLNQFTFALPRSLAGQGPVAISINSGGGASNTVGVSFK